MGGAIGGIKLELYCNCGTRCKKMAQYNVRKGWMGEELRREREASSLDLEELTNFLDGDESRTNRRRQICERGRKHTESE